MQNTKAGSIETHVRTCSLMRTYVWAHAYVRIGLHVYTCFHVPAHAAKKSPTVSLHSFSGGFSHSFSGGFSRRILRRIFAEFCFIYYKFIIYNIYSPKEIPRKGGNHPDGYTFALQNLQLELLIQQLNLLNRQLNLQLFFILRSQTSGPMPADESVFA